MGQWGALSLEQQRTVLTAALSAANKVALAGGRVDPSDAGWQALEEGLQVALEITKEENGWA